MMVVLPMYKYSKKYSNRKTLRQLGFLAILTNFNLMYLISKLRYEISLILYSASQKIEAKQSFEFRINTQKKV